MRYQINLEGPFEDLKKKLNELLYMVQDKRLLRVCVPQVAITEKEIPFIKNAIVGSHSQKVDSLLRRNHNPYPPSVMTV